MDYKDIKNIACVGAGVIGSSWATYFLYKGYQVRIYDIKEEFLDKANKLIENNLNFYVEKKIITEEEKKNLQSKVKYTTSMEEAVKEAQFIQESGPERLNIKHNMINELESFASEEAIIASSTSGLLVTDIASEATHPERIIGAHPFNPPHLIPLVEMTKGEKTSEEVLKTAYDFYKCIGKEPVVLQKESIGFIANRLQNVLYREAIDLVLTGVCSLVDVDKACLYGPGLRLGILGPNMIFHLGGGEGGLEAFLEKLWAPSAKSCLPTVGKWEEMPVEWPAIAAKGIEEELANRDKEQGQTTKEVAEFRDDMLVEYLKLHGKF